MKAVKKNFIWTLVVMAMSLSMLSCEEEGSDDNRTLDSELVGKWSVGEGDEATSYDFKSNGDLDMTTYAQTTEWEWETVEIGVVEMWMRDKTKDVSAVASLTYKVEGGKLYFWAESLETWGVPYSKED